MDTSAYNKRYKYYLTYKSNESLQLENDFCFDIPSNGCFPNLKLLELDLRIPNFEFVNELLRRCPLLEDLCVSATCLPIDDDVKYSFTFSIPTLKKLEFRLNDDNFYYCWPHEFIIKCQNLESLVVLDSSLSCFKIDEILLPSCLVEAKLDIGQSNYIHRFHVSKDEAKRAMEALKGVRNATSLSLGSGTSSFLSYVLDDDGDIDFPTFSYLVRLELDIDFYFGWKLLPLFLENSPLLKFLDLNRESEWTYVIEMDEGELEEHDNNVGWIQPKDVPKCLMQKLEEIKVKNLWRREVEGEVVKYLIENGQVLKNMSIKFDENGIGEEIDEVTIENFPRGSKKCEIGFF